MIPLVEELMTEKVYSIGEESSVLACAEQMEQNKIGSLFVVRDDGYVGIITEVDIVRKVVAKGLDPSAISVGVVMSHPLITIEENQSVLDANDLMEQKTIRHLGVTRKGIVVGVVSVRDLIHPLYMEPAAFGF